RIHHPNVVKVYRAVVLREIAINFHAFTGPIADAHARDEEVPNAIAFFKNLESGVFRNASVRIRTEDAFLIVTLGFCLYPFETNPGCYTQLFRKVEDVFSKKRLVVSGKIIVRAFEIVRVEKTKRCLTPIRRQPLTSIRQPMIIPRAQDQRSGIPSSSIMVNEPKFPAEVCEVVGE